MSGEDAAHAAPMQIVSFDALGRPRDGARVGTGDVLLLVRGEEISVVRLTLLPPGSFGPELQDATNIPELVEDARRAYREAYPEGLPDERNWTLVCPRELAERAKFPF